MDNKDRFLELFSKINGISFLNEQNDDVQSDQEDQFNKKVRETIINSFDTESFNNEIPFTITIRFDNKDFKFNVDDKSKFKVIENNQNQIDYSINYNGYIDNNKISINLPLSISINFIDDYQKFSIKPNTIIDKSKISINFE